MHCAVLYFTVLYSTHRNCGKYDNLSSILCYIRSHLYSLLLKLIQIFNLIHSFALSLTQTHSYLLFFTHIHSHLLLFTLIHDYLLFSLLFSLFHARKSSFSKDSACRQSAVSSLVALLRVRVRVSTAHGTRVSRGVEKGRGQGPGLSVDEVIALLKRCLTHQAAVRSLVYRQLYGLQRDHPVYRNVILRLLNSHLLSLLTDEEEETSMYMSKSISILHFFSFYFASIFLHQLISGFYD